MQQNKILNTLWRVCATAVSKRVYDHTQEFSETFKDGLSLAQVSESCYRA